MRASVNRWLVTAGEWVLLVPVWRRLIRPPGGRLAAALATAVAWLIILAVVASTGDGGSDPNDAKAAVKVSESAVPERTMRPTRSRIASPSPTPTANPTPGVTPSSSATGGPAATDASAGGPAVMPGAPPPGQTLSVVSSSSYTDDVGAFHVAGEVRNTGAEFMEFVEIAGAFFDASGQVLASEYTYTHADFVGPGEVAGFDLTVPDGTSLGINRYELAVQGEPTADRPAAGLAIQGESTSVDGGGDYHVTGTVLNQSAAPAEFVQIVGTFYTADGTVVRSEVAYTDLEVVPPGGTDTFDLSVPSGGSVGIARYSLKVEGFAV